MIANAHFSIRQSLDCKILSELAIGKVVSTELVLPITIRFDLVDKDCPVFAAMPRQISLAVSIDVEPSCHPSALIKDGDTRAYVVDRMREQGMEIIEGATVSAIIGDASSRVADYLTMT